MYLQSILGANLAFGERTSGQDSGYKQTAKLEDEEVRRM
jgi:hypothetical protein